MTIKIQLTLHIDLYVLSPHHHPFGKIVEYDVAQSSFQKAAGFAAFVISLPVLEDDVLSLLFIAQRLILSFVSKFYCVHKHRSQ